MAVNAAERSTCRIAAGCAAVALTLLVASVAAAADDQYVILGAGGRPCGSWLELRSRAMPESIVLQSWVLGYVTSVNANVLTGTGDVSRGDSPDALFAWIDNYCAAHPLDSVARAAGALLDSLLVKNKAQ